MMTSISESSSTVNFSFDHDEHKWRSVVNRNPVSNGAFLYGVISTKIFCRPICAARLPRRKNVVFFTDVRSAMASGFRPCLRCRPESDLKSPQSKRASVVARACRTIEANSKISLDQLSKEANLSKFHFQRTFKAVAGITPQQYKMACRKSLKSKHAGWVIFAVGPCYLGHILVAVSERGICAVDLGDDPELLVADLQKRFPSAQIAANHPEFNNLISILGGTAESSRTLEWELPLDIQGTAFQHRVWSSLREIPWGESRTYADIARNMGSPAAVRAVAKACAANPLAIAIPCHRVVRSDNTPSGYHWGLEKKVALAEMETSALENNCEPEPFRRWVQECINGPS